MVLAKDAKNITKAIKIHKFDSNRILTKKERSDVLEMQHSNLLVPSDIIIENGFCYAVYPCKDKETLADFIKNKIIILEKVAYVIIKKILDGYKALRNKGLIHGSIKPQNILIGGTTKLSVKLTDFLIVHHVKEDDKFIAPELTSENCRPNIMSDIWSIGKILEFMNWDNKFETCQNLIDKCLEKNVDERINFEALISQPCFTLIPLHRIAFNGNL